VSFVGASGREDLERARKLISEFGPNWPAIWLGRRGLVEWGELWELLQGRPK
jgi:hypothetical protein